MAGAKTTPRMVVIVVFDGVKLLEAAGPGFLNHLGITPKAYRDRFRTTSRS